MKKQLWLAWGLWLYGLWSLRLHSWQNWLARRDFSATDGKLMETRLIAPLEGNMELINWNVGYTLFLDISKKSFWAILSHGNLKNLVHNCLDWIGRLSLIRRSWHIGWTLYLFLSQPAKVTEDGEFSWGWCRWPWTVGPRIGLLFWPWFYRLGMEAPWAQGGVFFT